MEPSTSNIQDIQPLSNSQKVKNKNKLTYKICDGPSNGNQGINEINNDVSTNKLPQRKRARVRRKIKPKSSEEIGNIDINCDMNMLNSVVEDNEGSYKNQGINEINNDVSTNKLPQRKRARVRRKIKPKSSEEIGNIDINCDMNMLNSVVEDNEGSYKNQGINEINNDVSTNKLPQRKRARVRRKIKPKSSEEIGNIDINCDMNMLNSIVEDNEGSYKTSEDVASKEDESTKKKTNRCRRPNLKQFMLANTNMEDIVLNNSSSVNLNRSSNSASLTYEDSKDDIMKLQRLYFQMNNLSLHNSDVTVTKKSLKIKNAKIEYVKKTNDKKNNGKKINKLYEDYISEEDMLKGVNDGTLLIGSLRINPRYSKKAFVSHPDKKQKDIVIEGFKNRNRALEDDIVVVKLIEPSDDQEEKLMSCGKVVYIKKMMHSRISSGTLKLWENKDKQSGALFQPRDSKFPRLFIPLIHCPPNYQLEHKQFENSLFSAIITKWVSPGYTVGTILQLIGQSSDLKAQTKAILIENELDYAPYGNEFQHLYPNDQFVIPDEEIQKREDFRDLCVFTIDPATARDLDDAVSCKKLDNGNYEVGVHISDVTYYVSEGNALDDEVCRRATTVYLVDGTYHMLPRDLCLHCSLLPGMDKLTFSVVWEITPQGDVVNHRFTRGIINSCCQLAYEHVQYIIENPEKELLEKDFPTVLNGWNLNHLKNVVDILHKLAVIFRTRRFEGGALRIDQPKLWFKLDPANGHPLSFKIEEHNESHRLIEEFMLLANCTVAEKIFQQFPNIAFLRLHPPPKNTLDSVVENFMKLGIDLDVSSAGQLHSSLARHLADDNPCKSFVLHAHLIKTLSRALYFCSSGYDDDEIRHYALNAPIYTHFTSPIRRYADIVVHRLLASTLDYCPPLQWTPEKVQTIADNCNRQKYNAKKAGDMSNELYLLKYLSIHSPVQEKGAVMDIFENSFDVILFTTGMTRRIYFDNFSDTKTKIETVKNSNVPTIVTVKWQLEPEITQTFSVFDEINVVLEKTDDLLKINCKVVAPT